MVELARTRSQRPRPTRLGRCSCQCIANGRQGGVSNRLKEAKQKGPAELTEYGKSPADSTTEHTRAQKSQGIPRKHIYHMRRTSDLAAPSADTGV